MTIYLHILKNKDKRILIKEEDYEFDDENLTDEKVERVYNTLKLSSEPVHDLASYTFKLAKF